jgi:hypothetical protein
MTKRQHRLLAALLASALVGMPPQAVMACGYHGALGSEISLAHPASMGVALAVHDAVAAGRLQPLGELPPAAALMRANLLVQTLQRRLLSPGAALPPTAVLLAEGRLWNRFTPAAFGTTLQGHVNGPQTGDVTVVTSEAVLQALHDGRLGWDAAVVQGLAVVTDGAAPLNERVGVTLSKLWPAAEQRTALSVVP